MSINSFTFDGVSSEEMGLYVGGQKTFGAPQRDVTKVSIPGRNGDLVRDNGRFLNSEIAYNIVAMNDFKETAQNVRNWLMSAKGYKRLEDTYHPEHYRMARVSGGIDFETGAYNATGKAQILFDCMPQRFLKSGEEISDASMVNRTESGDILSFETVAESPITSAEVSLSPIQDLNGYDSPWPAGGGKNKLPITATTQTVSGVTFTVGTDGKITTSGTATADINFVINKTTVLTSGTQYHISGCASGGNGSNYYLRSTRGLVASAALPSFGTTATATADALYLFLHISNGINANGLVFTPMICFASETDATFSPYSNICPISGHAGAELNVAAEYDAEDKTTYSVTFSDQGTVYGGTYDFVSGKLEVQWANIASYNGETITEPWLSSMDVYSAGATPTTGAQVVYKLATPIEYTLTPQQLTTLLGQNNVWGSGPITLTYVEPSVIENPTPFEAKPLIRVYGSGTCTVTINNQIITINNVTDFVDIDCETMNCYNGVVNKNADVVLGAQGFPVLPAGKTMIKTGGGTTKIEITPRWWEL